MKYVISYITATKSTSKVVGIHVFLLVAFGVRSEACDKGATKLVKYKQNVFVDKLVGLLNPRKIIYRVGKLVFLQIERPIPAK